MEPALRRGRSVALALLAVSVGLAAWAALASQSSFVLFSFLAHVSLSFFVATEAFGPVARQRSRSSKVIARVILVPSLIVTGGTGAYLLGLVL
jgi:hypothetical protein